jgi:integrase/recombinase XerD
MNNIRQGVQQYLTLRGGLGFVLQNERTALYTFVSFLEAEGASHITIELAMRWATQSVGVQSATWGRRLGMVRRFAVWFSAFDPRTEVPSQGLLPYHNQRRRPYIYSNNEIKELLRAAAKLPSPKGLRGLTCSTVFGLLVVTGMRVSEALSLDCDDVNLAEGILTIRRTKFGKSRLVFVHPSTQTALGAYVEVRDRLFPRAKSQSFFVTEQGTRITPSMAGWAFVQASRSIGLRPPGKRRGKGPRLHDLRHRFAVQTLINWYRADLDVERELPKLSTYLGHTHVNDTYWYLEAVPELLQLATKRLERRATGGEP